MTQPTPEVKQDYHYQVDQQVSVNAFIDIDVSGENVRFQVTSRYGASAEKIAKTAQSAIEAFALLRETYPRSANAPAPAVQSGESKKYEKKPVAANELPEGLPEGIECFKEDFDEVEIIPQPDNKASVSFWRDGMKFPVGAKINKWKIENVKTSLNVLGEIDPTKAQKVRIAGTQYYSNGNEFTDSKGNKAHYKDLRLIVARF